MRAAISCVELVVAGVALGGGERGQVGPIEPAGQGPPLVVVGAGDGHPGSPSRCDRCRRPPGRRRGGPCTRSRLPRPSNDPAVDLGVEQGRGLEVHRRLGLRQVEVLALAGAAAVVEGGQQGGQAEAGGHDVGVGPEGPRGRPVGPAGGGGEAEQGGGEVAQARHVERAGLARQAARQQDQPGVGGPQSLVAEAHPVERRRPRSSRPCTSAHRPGPTACPGRPGRPRSSSMPSLPALQLANSPLPSMRELVVAGMERGGGPGQVGPGPRLHLDHRGAEVGQRRGPRRVRPPTTPGRAPAARPGPAPGRCRCRRPVPMGAEAVVTWSSLAGGRRRPAVSMASCCPAGAPGRGSGGERRGPPRSGPGRRWGRSPPGMATRRPRSPGAPGGRCPAPRPGWRSGPAAPCAGRPRPPGGPWCGVDVNRVMISPSRSASAGGTVPANRPWLRAIKSVSRVASSQPPSSQIQWNRFTV